MYCPKCGTENPDDTQLCRSCSWVLTSISTTALAPDARTSGLAIAALILGILTFFTLGITAIPAIILGIVGIFKIEKSAGQLKGKGLAIAGIAVPAASLFFVVPIMMLAILMPALARARVQAKQVACAANLTQISFMMVMYINDYDEQYPTADRWCDLLEPYSGSNEKIFVCPAAGDGRCHYAINPNAKPSSHPYMVLLFETYPGWNQAGGPEILTTENHYGEGCNILFVDLHVQFVKTEDLDDLKWTAEQND